MFTDKWTRVIVLGVLPAICITALNVFILTTQRLPPHEPSVITGEPLAFFSDLYPVYWDGYDLQLDTQRFVDAIHHFNQHPSKKAASDLMYLGQSNNVALQLSDEERSAYHAFLENHIDHHTQILEIYRDRVFEMLSDVVDGIGETFSGTGIEIVLHDTRNPLQSIQAIQNPISGRRLLDPTTNFGVELIKMYSAVNRKASNFVSYELTMGDGRTIKSTTVPLYDRYVGLIGFVCLNIDIDQLNHPAGVETFLQAFAQTYPNTDIDEVVEHSRVRKLSAQR